jgi:DNA-binding LytR/AlgR family response regulator
MDGIETAQHVQKLPQQPHIIFTTAYDTYAIRAFDLNAVDYLLKPIDPDDLKRALEKIENQRITPQFDFESISRFFKKESYKDRFLVKTGQRPAIKKGQTSPIVFGQHTAPKHKTPQTIWSLVIRVTEIN